MFETHYTPLVIAYLAALAGWLWAHRALRGVWPRSAPEGFERPWKEFLIALLGGIGVLAVGQLYIRGLRLPEGGALGPVLAAVNQVLIFAPILLVVVIRRQPWTSAWLPGGRWATRLLTGLALGGIAVTVYTLLREGADAPWAVLGRIWRYGNIDEMTQVLLEDLTIAILFVRLARAIGNRWATVVVACLFAAGHVPAMLAEGATLTELAALLRDAGLGVAVILVLQRSRDILWFWCIHFSLDMTQFTRINGVG